MKSIALAKLEASDRKTEELSGLRKILRKLLTASPAPATATMMYTKSLSR
ncbi:hypothetical protein NKH02_23650 [Mesorhizobium sp. M1396]